MTSQGRGFLGAVHDSNALVLLGARFFDPGSGVFVSVDPLLDPGNPAQFNAYVYAGNNPVTWSDPSGLAWTGPVADGGDHRYTWKGKTGTGKTKPTAGSLTKTATTPSTTVSGVKVPLPAAMGGCGMSYNPCGGRGVTEEQRWQLASWLLDGQVAGAAAIFVGGPKGGMTAKSTKRSTLAANQAAGNKARDEVAAQYPGARIEQVRKTTSGGARRIDVLTPRGVAIEVKLGRVSMSPTIYRQIMRDVALRDEGRVSGVEWVFKYSTVTGEVGPAPSVAMLLNSKNIAYSVAP